MNDRQAFLNAIIESPEDNGLRLIYADWLDENGEPEQAELIRVQIEVKEKIAKGTPPVSLENREAELIESIRLSDVIRTTIHNVENLRYEFERGLIEWIECSAQDWEANATAILSECPIREVELTTMPEVTPHQRLFNWQTMTQPMPDWYAIQVERHPKGTTGKYVAPTITECYEAWYCQWPRIKFTRPHDWYLDLPTPYGFTNGTNGSSTNFGVDDLVEVMRDIQLRLGVPRGLFTTDAGTQYSASRATMMVFEQGLFRKAHE